MWDFEGNEFDAAAIFIAMESRERFKRGQEPAVPLDRLMQVTIRHTPPQ